MNADKLDNLINNMEKTKNSLWKVEKKIIGFLKNIAVAGVEYAVMAYVFFWIFDKFGLEKTAITLAIGIILFGLRQRMDSGMKDIEIKDLRKQVLKLKGAGNDVKS